MSRAPRPTSTVLTRAQGRRRGVRYGSPPTETGLPLPLVLRVGRASLAHEVKEEPGQLEKLRELKEELERAARARGSGEHEVGWTSCNLPPTVPDGATEDDVRVGNASSATRRSWPSRRRASELGSSSSSRAAQSGARFGYWIRTGPRLRLIATRWIGSVTGTRLHCCCWCSYARRRSTGPKLFLVAVSTRFLARPLPLPTCSNLHGGRCTELPLRSSPCFRRRGWVSTPAACSEFPPVQQGGAVRAHLARAVMGRGLSARLANTEELVKGSASRVAAAAGNIHSRPRSTRVPVALRDGLDLEHHNFPGASVTATGRARSR